MEKYLKEIKNFYTLTFEEEQELFKKYSLGDISAREKLIEHNLPLVLFISKKYNNFINMDEIISAGNEALIKCVDTFDYTKNYKFNTYAFKYIKFSIINRINIEKKFKTEEINDNEISFIQPELFNSDKTFIIKLLNILNDMEKDLIVNHYINGESLEEIGKKYNMNRQLSNYYFDKGMEKLRKKINNTNIKKMYGY